MIFKKNWNFDKEKKKEENNIVFTFFVKKFEGKMAYELIGQFFLKGFNNKY